MQTIHTEVPTDEMSANVSRQQQSGRAIMIAGAILILALIWRLIGIQATEVWRDEAVSLMHIHDAWSDLCIRLPLVEDSPPLYFLLMKAWSLLFTSEWGMRLQAVLFGVATVAALMMWAGMIESRSVWAVGLLAAFAHVPVHYSQELRVYSLMTLSVVLGFWSAEHITRDPNRRRWPILMGLFSVLSAHCHAVGIFVYPMIWIYLLIRLSKPQLRILLNPWHVGTCLVGCIPMFWFNIYWAIQHKASGWWVDPLCTNSTCELLNRFFGLEVLLLWIEETLPMDMAKLLSTVVAALIYVAYISLAVIAVSRSQTRRSALALLGAGAFFILMLLATSLMGVPNIIARTLLPAWLPILLLIAIGASTMDNEPIRSFIGKIATGLIVLSCAVSWVWFMRYSDRMQDLRPSFAKSFRWISQQVQPNDMIVVTPSWAEDSTAYYLRDVIAGEQLFTTSSPVYAGRPPRHTLSHYRLTVTRDRVEEGPWSQRLRSAIKERSGRNYSVWLICGLWQDLFNDPGLEQLESFFTTDFECYDTYTPVKLAGLKVRRFVPKGVEPTHE